MQDTSRLLSSLLSPDADESGSAPCVAAWRKLPARQAEFAPFPADLSLVLKRALGQRGINSLYSHQAECWQHAREGRHFVVVTGTASGKTLCYQLPVLDRLLRDPQARTLFLFPTKALAHDQLASLAQLTALPIATYDGDTPAGRRAAIRERARIVVTNPDMLHAGILPHHPLWAELLGHLAFVVIDELHVYRGVFGSHVANVLRRLKRAASFYGGSPQFILTSATIGNPAELAERLIEAPVATVDRDGAARGAKHFVIYNPPIVQPALGLRKSALLESARLTRGLLSQQIQTIVFGRSRQTVEQLLRYLNPRPASIEPNTIRGYRGGYLPRRRREIEQGLRDGSIRAVVATNALELGVDIGGMGAAVLVGYPGSIAATWQQAGRAGRTGAESLAVLVASAEAMDQFLARHPDYFFGHSPERALINPDNLLILLAHLRCAAFELPFTSGEAFGSVEPERVSEFLEFLAGEGLLHPSGGRYFWMADRYPADGVSLRSASADRVTLQVEGETIGEVDRESAYWMVHPHAIYLHDGESFIVNELDLEHGLARLTATDADYYTQPRIETSVQLLDQLEEAEVHGAVKAYGEIAVTRQITGFRRIQWFTHENLGEGIVSLPPTELHTTGYWVALKEETIARLRDLGLWSNDPNDYGPNWPDQRRRARARDGYRCQSCGAVERGREHDVHHKIPFRTFPSFQQANDLANLVTLCHGCHRSAEQAVRIRSGLAGLGYALAQLTPLSLMCDARDIGVHSDPRSPLADGRPTVVIYDQTPAGIGFSEQLFELHPELVRRALELVAGCGCEDGCPSCVGPGGENGSGGKREAQALLETLSGDHQP